MGLFSFLKSSNKDPLAKHVARIANKRAQAVDRSEAIYVLSQAKSEAAIEALITRFSFRVDPSITDEEEKEAAFAGIVGAGEVAIAPLRRWLEEGESLAWPLKMLSELLPEAEVTDALIELLKEMDTEYERDPQKKISLIAVLGECKDERIVEAAKAFLEDVNDTVRFNAVATIAVQENRELAKEALAEALVAEESVRVRIKILEIFASERWSFGEARDVVETKLPKGFAIDRSGYVRRKG